MNINVIIQPIFNDKLSKLGTWFEVATVVCGCNSQADTQEAPLTVWFLWGLNAGPSACKAGVIPAALLNHMMSVES